jgi:hypothetical protein
MVSRIKKTWARHETLPQCLAGLYLYFLMIHTQLPSKLHRSLSIKVWFTILNTDQK